MRHLPKLIFFLPALLAVLLLPDRQEPSASIMPNSAFGDSGVVLTGIGSGFSGAEAVGVQPDGKIVVAGSTDSGIDRDIAVLRYLPDGTEDPEFLFSSGSLIGADFGDDSPHGLVINDDGTILVGGTILESGVKSGFLARLLADGQLDYSFGDQGITLLSGEADVAFNDIDTQSDGAIVAVGSQEVDGTTRPLVARFESDGALDSIFGTGGSVVDTEVEARFSGIAIQADGALVAGGTRVNLDGRQGLYAARYTTDGSLDESFAETGRVSVFEDAEEIVVHDIGLQPDGTIVVVGEVLGSEDFSSMLLGRIQGDGSADTSLSINGLLVYDIGSQSAAYGVTVVDNGLILATGYRSGTDGQDLVVLRYDESAPAPAESETEASTSMAISGLQVEQGPFVMADGPSYRSIDEADLITTAIGGSDESGTAIAVGTDSMVYIAGYSGSDETASILVASYGETTQVTPLAGAETEGPVRSEFYAIETVPITDITRTSALTGGEITVLTSSDTDCVTECQEACEEPEPEGEEGAEGEEGEDSEDETSCREQCELSCEIPTVEKRGVVFSVDPNPVYEEVEDTTDGTTDSGTDSGTGDTDTDGTGTDTDGTDDTDTDGTDSDSDGTDETDNDGSGTENPLARDKLFDFDSWFVTGGQTDDGTGPGAFMSEIVEVNPQTVYYVRAYAVLSDGTIQYGNELYFRTDDSCFIATAAFGTIDDFAVQALRQFRDRFLLPYDWGRSFVRAYYHFSPPLADIVADSVLLRSLVMMSLLPLVALALFMLHVPLVLQYLLVCLATTRLLIIRPG